MSPDDFRLASHIQMWVVT